MSERWGFGLVLYIEISPSFGFLPLSFMTLLTFDFNILLVLMYPVDLGGTLMFAVTHPYRCPRGCLDALWTCLQTQSLNVFPGVGTSHQPSFRNQVCNTSHFPPFPCAAPSTLELLLAFESGGFSNRRSIYSEGDGANAICNSWYQWEELLVCHWWPDHQNKYL